MHKSLRMVTLTVVAASACLPLTALAAPVSKSATVGAYRVTLKILPAEAFAGANGEMMRTGGAQPRLLSTRPAPNHHLVVFIRQHGKPVENARVRIQYEPQGASPDHWMNLPVARMQVKGKGAATTHYGNNVRLGDGGYEARVSVDGSPWHRFHFKLTD